MDNKNNNRNVSTAWLIGRILRNLSTLKTSKDEIERGSLTYEIRIAIDELEGIRKYFEVVDDPELIDYAIYREKAAIMRLSYLLKKAKYNNKKHIKSLNI